MSEPQWVEATDKTQSDGKLWHWYPKGGGYTDLESAACGHPYITGMPRTRTYIFEDGVKRNLCRRCFTGYVIWLESQRGITPDFDETSVEEGYTNWLEKCRQMSQEQYDALSQQEPKPTDERIEKLESQVSGLIQELEYRSDVERNRQEMYPDD